MTSRTLHWQTIIVYYLAGWRVVSRVVIGWWLSTTAIHTGYNTISIPHFHKHNTHISMQALSAAGHFCNPFLHSTMSDWMIWAQLNYIYLFLGANYNGAQLFWAQHYYARINIVRFEWRERERIPAICARKSHFYLYIFIAVFQSSTPIYM